MSIDLGTLSLASCSIQPLELADRFRYQNKSIAPLCYDGEGDLQQSNVTVGQIYHRKQSKQPDEVETARKQIASKELWGGPARNFFQSHIPKVKGYLDKLPQDQNGIRITTGIEFNTEVAPDRNTKPGGAVYWSGEREGVRTEDEYAKIKVRITYCNQFDPVYIADD